MTSHITTEPTADADLWRLACQGNTPAFEVLVERHQSLVSAVAYNACGNLSLSEDVAQETFWTAWRDRASLIEAGSLCGWLCGIARNLGKNARRKAARPAEAAASLAAAATVAANTKSPVEQMVSREEADLVWQALKQIPESYREPLILFYREEKSLAAIAPALGLSENAVKQRLFRGRDMLRQQVTGLVEGVLQRSRPGRGFTLSVMAGLTGISAGAKTALAAAGGAATGTAVKSVGVLGLSGAATGALGGILGSLGGLGGAWLGTWLPAQMAETKSERECLWRMFYRVLIAAVTYIVLLQALIIASLPVAYYLVGLVALDLAYLVYLFVVIIKMNRQIRRIRADSASAEPNNSPFRARLIRLVEPYRGRVYRSRMKFLGLPFIDINVADPLAGQYSLGLLSTGPRLGAPEPKVACGWIAIGDVAHGLLFAFGNKSRGLIAMGGRTVGVISIGGFAVGVFALGGCAVGIVAFGGAALGGLALGGLAIGWQALGGGAIAWDVAVGGGAMAWNAAFGGGAYAHHIAVGGNANALHANDEIAKTFFAHQPLRQYMDWLVVNRELFRARLNTIILLSILITIAFLPVMYRRKKVEQVDPTAADQNYSK